MPYAELQRRALLGTGTVLLALAGFAWWATVDAAGDMRSMSTGLADIGQAMPFSMSAVLFLSMWTTMMIAMMFPAVAPIVLLHRLTVRRRGEGTLPTVAFTGGYLAVWAALGVVPLLVLLGFHGVTEPSDVLRRAAGAVLVLAGAYQFTRWKDTCLRACRSPITFLATHRFNDGYRGAFHAGVSHGLYCAGCCWALMAVLFVVGLMNLAWMAAIALVFLAEKNWRHGVLLTKVVGTSVLALGLVVVAHPPVLAALGTATTTESAQDRDAEMRMD